jgi:GTP cyclohydrolase I
MAMDDAKVSSDVSEENADGPVEGAKGVNGRAAPSDDSGSRPATPALLGEFAGAAAAPPAAAEAVERMMRALGLDARMSADRLAATARRYADLMAASREGHAMASSDAAAACGWCPGMDAPAAGEKRKRRAADRPDDATDDAIDGSFEMVVERDLELATLCEHHLLPFHGAVHVAYLRPASGLGSGPAPGSGPAAGSGLTRAALQRIVTTHGRRLQVQERLTRDIARDVRAASGARGVMVAVRASHLCMIARGVEKPGSTTCTSACLGAFAGSGDRRGAFWRALAGDARGGEKGRR